MQTIQKTIKTLAIIIGLMASLPAFGMENKQQNPPNQQTMADDWSTCDWCGTIESPIFVVRAKKHQNSWHCFHIFCNECNDRLSKHDNTIKSSNCWWDCKYCSALLPHKKNIHMRIASPFYKSAYGEEVHFFLNDKKQHRHGGQAIPYYITHDGIHPLPTLMTKVPEKPKMLKLTDFISDNKIKLLGAAGIAVIACYGIYKWWKGKDTQEKDVDEQENEKKEETQPAEQV